MGTNREQLVADWREQLAMAEAASTGRLPHAWLARTRMRLYSFLLTCYGEGQWRTDARPAEDERTSFVVDTTGQHVQEKPVRSAGQIQSVLKTVANAQDDPHAPGPLRDGLDPNSWIIVAAAGSGFSIDRCQYLFRTAGIVSRVGFQGRDKVLKVPATSRRQAFELLDRNRQVLQVPKRRLKSNAQEKSLLFGLLMAFGVLAITALFSYPYFLWPDLRPGDRSYETLLRHNEFDAAWQRVFVAVSSAAGCICLWLFCGWVYCRIRRRGRTTARLPNAASNSQA